MDRDRHIERSGDDYAEAFSSLLPQGIAWPREPSSVLMRVVKGLAQFWGYVDATAAKLLKLESDPRTTQDLLLDWERNFGLPDECFAEPFTIGDRQFALVQRMTIEGGQSRQFFIDFVAERLGYEITITEWRPFMVGIDRVGDNRTIGNGSLMYDQFNRPILDTRGNPVSLGELSEYPYVLGPPENRFYWQVHVGSVRLTWFRVGAGGGQTGIDPHLRISLATDLECILNRWKPAHTQIIFDYSELDAARSVTVPQGNLTLSTTGWKNIVVPQGNLKLTSGG